MNVDIAPAGSAVLPGLSFQASRLEDHVWEDTRHGDWLSSDGPQP
jgi:hypothetical protein